MTRKPENSFIANVHKHITGVYCEKMFNPYRAGTPDVWYSGMGSDLWIEYKYIVRAQLPKSIKPNLSKQQVYWIRNRIHEGRTVWVATGIRVAPSGKQRQTLVHIIQHLPTFGGKYSVDERDLLSPKQLAQRIMETCGENSDHHSNSQPDVLEKSELPSNERSKDS